ncbi:hypothetical protein NL676_019589 [Syzygium grande]|nr:hypothetical protein NL676_019589 [Syzygium grande]
MALRFRFGFLIERGSSMFQPVRYTVVSTCDGNAEAYSDLCENGNWTWEDRFQLRCGKKFWVTLLEFWVAPGVGTGARIQPLGLTSFGDCPATEVSGKQRKVARPDIFYPGDPARLNFVHFHLTLPSFPVPWTSV